MCTCIPASRHGSGRVWLRVLLAAWLCALFTVAHAQRVALLIGNGQYKHESTLRNPERDVRLLAQTLRTMDFRVQVLVDLPKREMDLAIRRFVRESAGADTALLYFAGHGQQPSRGGRSYLLPVDANAVDDDALEADGILAEEVAAQLERLPNPARLRLVILDACRNTRAVARSSVRGLAPPARTDSYTLIAYSTDANAVAQDGQGDNSPYAQALARQLPRALKEPVRLVFEETAKEVRSATRQQQTPRTYGDLESRIGLDGRLVASVVPEPAQQRPVAPQADSEQEAWELAKRRDTVQAYEAYLQRYPQGRYRQAAEVALAGLRPAPAPAPQPEQARPTAQSAGQVVQDCAECPKLVVIPSGSFTMGSPESEAGRDSDEGPQRRVNVGSFLLGRTEVTRGEFGAFVQATGYRSEAETGGGCYVWNGSKWEQQADKNWRNSGMAQDDSHPVACVSWNDAQKYVQWLSQKTGKRYMLPSEAQWEYACRGGGTHRYCGGDDVNELGWYNQNSGGKTQPVGRKRANTFGLHDMSGNVWEWVQDVYHDSYSGAPSDGSAWMQGGNQERRVIRGGSWSNVAGNLRAADRNWVTPGIRVSYLGLRIARTLE